MGRLSKIVGAVVAVIAVVTVVLVVLVRVLITPERVKAVVVPFAEAKLQRKVNLGDIKVGFLTGIELHDLAVAERDGPGQLLTVDLARLRFQWLPLLARRVFGLPLQASGTVRINEAAWHGLPIRDLSADYTLRDNQLTIQRMTGTAAGGAFTATSRIDLGKSEPGYAADIQCQSMQAEAVLAALSPRAADSLAGTMDLQATFAGQGADWDVASRALDGEVTLALADGRLTSPELVHGLAILLQSPDLKELRFRDLRGTARIAAGQAQVAGAILGSQLKLYPQGTIGLDGSLNLAVDARLSPEQAAKLDRRGQVSRYLRDAEGWARVPLLVTGSLQAPRLGLDPAGVQSLATRALERELQRGLDQLLDKRQRAAQPPARSSPPPPDQPSRENLEKSLQRLLGR